MKLLAQALYDQLMLDAELADLIDGSIWLPPARPPAGLPRVEIHKATGDRTHTFKAAAGAPSGTTRQYEYDVKGVCDSNDGTTSEFADRLTASDAIAERIEAVLHDNEDLDVTGWRVLLCRHAAEIDYNETTRDGRVLYHRGSTFHIDLAP